MNTAARAESLLRIRSIDVTERMITAELTDGRVVSLPLSWSWRLERASPEQRRNWELIADGIGVHWPDIDEDLSAQGFLTGSPAPRPRQKSSRTP